MKGRRNQAAGISDIFQSDTARPTRQKTKRPAPLSIRVSEAERVWLNEQAAGGSISAFVKQRIFRGSSIAPAARSGGTRIDDTTAAKILAALGQSRIASNLNQIAKAVNLGTLPMNEETERDIREACAAVIQVKAVLMACLRTSPEVRL
ncbi:plasmid mobilization relaxosome protein MobC [Parvularcula marina]|uniref:Plasmid mobilization relaxosome protein MobC n=1 Tax=Parvularcula marina TaxID=2292771 RepID=A0A371RFQ1_9PROT|nr:plasmid mobilization relaxosome protein MobC [Parvularcula marina]RFB04273.1 plasmid mobilization relaxosome protein MobC [Parvularcula marina]